jgi:hypothetical protein
VSAAAGAPTLRKPRKHRIATIAAYPDRSIMASSSGYSG